MPKRLSARAPGDLDTLFHALADPTRRAIIERLGNGPAPTSELARPFEMALPSVTQHLDVLEACGVVHSRKLGRVRTYRLAEKPLELAEHWLAAQRARWTQRLDQLDEFLETNPHRNDKESSR
jgi:DNA-binding transcriptional ArsR family regulator